MEGWRGELGERDDVADCPVVFGRERGERAAIGFACHDLADNRLGFTSHGMRSS
jgi:hypothetical protein